jgi:Uma2 family endonuclease
MAITELVSVEEYLHSTFEHDAEYLEGRIVARSAPEKPHSKTQGYLCRTLYQVAHPLGYEVWVEQRIHTQPAPARYRVPDLCVTQGEPPEDIFTEPPFLCLEILSRSWAAGFVRDRETSNRLQKRTGCNGLQTYRCARALLQASERLARHEFSSHRRS